MEKRNLSDSTNLRTYVMTVYFISEVRFMLYVRYVINLFKHTILRTVRINITKINNFKNKFKITKRIVVTEEIFGQKQ